MLSPSSLPDDGTRSPLARAGRSALLLIVGVTCLSLSACGRQAVAPVPEGSPAVTTASPQSVPSHAPAHGQVRGASDPSRASLKPYLRMLNRVRLRPADREPILERLREIMLEQGLLQIDERLVDISALLEQATKLAETDYQQQRRRLAMRIRERARANGSPATPAPLRLEKGTGTPR